MSAKLSGLIGGEWSSAVSAEKFFGNKEMNDIRKRFESREHSKICIPGESCRANLFFGFFFDGTKNNYVLAEAGRNHSNVARLYDCYPGLSVPGVLPKSTDWQYQPENYTNFFKVYVPGVSSPFSQVGDTGAGIDNTAGGASGALGERRIIWTLVQAVNNLHRYFLKKPLISQGETDLLVRRIVLNKYARALMTSSNPANHYVTTLQVNIRARQEFNKILLKLKAAIAPHIPDSKTGLPAKIDPGVVKTIFVSTFGFSRGATQSRAFMNWLQSLCMLDAQIHGRSGGMTLGGFQVVFDFLGVFDTVASVGLGNTLGNNLFGRYLDGHGAWADSEDSLRIPAGLKCLHLVAAHELRRSFPVDSISVNGVLPEGCKEVVIPGVHSDIGCGYSPCEQGKGLDPNGDDMLSRIALLSMYREARLSGVPLKLEMASATAKARFALKPSAIKDFNAYIATCKETTGPIHRIMREQARKQMEWRLMRRVSGKNALQNTTCFKRASTFDQNDLFSAGQEFEQEITAFLKWRNEKTDGFRPTSQKAGFDNDHLAEWEEIATWWRETPQPTQAEVTLFDNYVHDSRAWFKLIPGNPDNENDLRKTLGEWSARRKAGDANHNEHRVRQASAAASSRFVFVGKFDDSHRPARDDGLSDEERRIADEYAKTGNIPRMITRGREPFDSSWKSYGLSSRAGYLRFRKIYSGDDAFLVSSLSASDAGLQQQETSGGEEEGDTAAA